MNTFFDKCYMQFCSEEALKCLGIDELLYNSNVRITDYFTDDIELLKKRSIIFSDTFNIPGMYELLERISNNLSDIAELLRSESEIGDKERSIFSIKQLQLYFDIIDAANDFFILIPHGLTFGSNEYKKLFLKIHSIAQSSDYISLKTGTKELMDKIVHMKSISVGFNLNARLAPYEMGVLSINPKPICSGKLIDKILRIDFADDGLKAIETIVPVNKSCKPDEYQLLQNSLYSVVDKIFIKAVRNWPNEIKKYINNNLRFLLELLPDFRFIIVVTKIHLKLKKIGLPMCLPTYHPKEDKIFNATKLYNPLLAINFFESSSTKRIVGNDISFDENGMIYILTGPNNGGKTVFLSSVGIAQVLAQLGMLIPATNIEISPVDHIFVHYPKYLTKEKMGRLEDECVRVREFFETLNENCLCLFDETFSSTDSEEGCFLAFEILKAINNFGARAIFGTHFHHLINMVNNSNQDEMDRSKFDFLCAEIVNGKNITYQITRSQPEGKSYALGIAMKYGLSYDNLISLNNQQIMRGDLPPKLKR